MTLADCHRHDSMSDYFLLIGQDPTLVTRSKAIDDDALSPRMVIRKEASVPSLSPNHKKTNFKKT